MSPEAGAPEAGAPEQRRSMGGYVVEAGLAAGGWRPQPGVALVETARPGRTPYPVVLAQSAWNVVDRRTFRRLLKRHPLKRRPRVVARRLVATYNLRRAGKVVTLTEAMGDLCRRYNPRVEVAPVTVPVDFLGARPATDPAWARTVLVPGTVTWHKATADVPAVVIALRERGQDLERIVLAGSDDGSGCLEATLAAAERAGIPCEQRPMTRDEMLTACASAAVVLLPSELESLSLSLAESLLLSQHVVARRIPAHEELAVRLERQPVWLEADGTLSPGETPPVADRDLTPFLDEWAALARALTLPTIKEIG